MPETGTLHRDRLVAKFALERARAEARAELLPFGDGYLDDPTPEWHGTNVGLQRHADAGQPPCPPCAALLDELLAAGLARPRPAAPEPEETPLPDQTTNQPPATLDDLTAGPTSATADALSQAAARAGYALVDSDAYARLIQYRRDTLGLICPQGHHTRFVDVLVDPNAEGYVCAHCAMRSSTVVGLPATGRGIGRARYGDAS